MKFDKTKVFTPFNCNEVKDGSKGYFEDNAHDLEVVVINDVKQRFGSVRVNKTTTQDYCFFITEQNGNWRYFYLVEEPKEPAKRSCTREELIEMLKKQGLPMLLRKDNDTVYTFVYLQSKTLTAVSSLSQRYIHYTYEELCAEFTLLDGTELWVEE